MTETPTPNSTIEELEKAINLFYSYQEQTEEMKALHDQLVTWASAPENISTQLEIIATSQNERLRFFVAVSLNHFINKNGRQFSPENFAQMAELFTKFIMNNANRIDKQDCKYVMLSLATICGINFSFLEQIGQIFPVEIFLLFFAYFTETINDSYFRPRYVDREAEEAILKQQLQPVVFEMFSQVPFNDHWAQAFQKIFFYYLTPEFCIPYLEQIKMMAKTHIELFIKFFDHVIHLDFSQPEVLLFDSELTVVAIEAAQQNPNLGFNIWQSLFSTDVSFFVSSDRIEFTENVFKCFFDQIQGLFVDFSNFADMIDKLFEFLNTVIQEVIDQFPSELLAKYMICFCGNIIEIYNEHPSAEFSQRIIFWANKFVNTEFRPVVKSFIAEQPLSSGSILFFASMLFSETESEDNEALNAVLVQLFSFEEMPSEGFEFITRKIMSQETLFSPFYPQYVQKILTLLQKNPCKGAQELKKFSLKCTPFIVSISKDLQEFLFPVLPSLDLDTQSYIYLTFFLILNTSQDSSILQTIHDMIIASLQAQILSQDPDNILSAINFVSRLYSDFDQKGGTGLALIKEFMTALFPEIFHLFTPILMIQDINIQNKLSSFVFQAGCKQCIPITTVDYTEAINDEVIEWILTIIQSYLVENHFLVLKILGIKPFGPILEVISNLDSESDILSEMFSYIQQMYDKNSDELWQVIPPQFFMRYLDPENPVIVVKSVASMLRDLHIANDEIRSMIFECVMSHLRNYFESPEAFNEIIKLIIVLIGNNDDIFDSFAAMFAQISSTDTPELQTFLANLKKYCKYNSQNNKKATKSLSNREFYEPLREHFSKQS